jgi:hypothetical protein
MSYTSKEVQRAENFKKEVNSTYMQYMDGAILYYEYISKVAALLYDELNSNEYYESKRDYEVGQDKS